MKRTIVVLVSKIYQIKDIKDLGIKAHDSLNMPIGSYNHLRYYLTIK